MAFGTSWLARFVWLIHFAVVVFFVLGWMLPWSWALWAVAIGVPSLQITWRAFDDRCPLTMLEEKLRGPGTGLPQPPEDAEQPRNFVADLLSSVLGHPVSHRITNLLVHGFTWLAFLVAILRLVLGEFAPSF